MYTLQNVFFFLFIEKEGITVSFNAWLIHYRATYVKYRETKAKMNKIFNALVQKSLMHNFKKGSTKILFSLWNIYKAQIKQTKLKKKKSHICMEIIKI